MNFSQFLFISDKPFSCFSWGRLPKIDFFSSLRPLGSTDIAIEIALGFRNLNPLLLFLLFCGNYTSTIFYDFLNQKSIFFSSLTTKKYSLKILCLILTPLKSIFGSVHYQFTFYRHYISLLNKNIHKFCNFRQL